MPDDDINPVELVELISVMASEVAPIEASAFRVRSLENLAALHEQQQKERSTDSPSGFAIPEKYSGKQERFLVFDAFLASFIRSSDLPFYTYNLLKELSGQDGPSTIGFARSGEDQLRMEVINRTDLTSVAREREHLYEFAEELGRDLFGDMFDPRDFWDQNERDLQG